LSGRSAAPPGGNFPRRRRSGSFCPVCAAKDSIVELCRREGIVQNLYYRWSKEFLEAGKKRLAGDTARAATSDEVKELRREASALKEVVAELTLENRLLKKSAIGVGEDGA
jgi:transposase